MTWSERGLWLAVAVSAVLIAFNLASRRGADHVARAAPPAPQLRGMAPAEIGQAKVKAFPTAAKQALKLPPEARRPAVHVLGAARVESQLRPVTVTATLDSDTGDVTLYEKREPLPLIAIPHRGEAGVAYGLKDGHPAARLYVNQALLDVKALRLSATATLDQDGDTFAGMALSYRW